MTKVSVYRFGKRTPYHIVDLGFEETNGVESIDLAFSVVKSYVSIGDRIKVAARGCTPIEYRVLQNFGFRVLSRIYK